jgi:glutathione-regulated potassium-efflux system ancillary protein KefG
LALGLLKHFKKKKKQAPPPHVLKAVPGAHHAALDPMRCALLVLAHPALQHSRVNAAMLAAARTIDQVTLHDLYQEYADFLIDVAADQKRLMHHRLIILQFPLYWYSTPALLKEWLDMVLLHGFAHGRGGTKLHGKRLLCAITAGGGAEYYTPEGINRFSMEELLRPLEATAHLCGLVWTPPFIVHDAIALDVPGRRAAADAYRARLAELIAEESPGEAAVATPWPAPSLVRG